MGKRRDRRHAAALGGGGRRMKLDLWNNDEAEKVVTKEKGLSITTTVEDGDEKSGAGSDEGPSPQSLPGAVQMNPLSLLGQYSDDEEEETEPPMANGSAGVGSADVAAGHVDEQVASFLADLETSGLLKDEEISKEEPTGDVSGSPTPEAPEEGKISLSNGNLIEDSTLLGQDSDSLLTRIDGDEGVEHKSKKHGCDWEAVLHAESGEYYFWNKLTGETTWEKPKAVTDLEDSLKVLIAEESTEKPLAEDHEREIESDTKPIEHESVVEIEETHVENFEEESMLGSTPEVQIDHNSRLGDALLRDPEDDDDIDIFPEVREKFGTKPLDDEEHTFMFAEDREKKGAEPVHSEVSATIVIDEAENKTLSEDSPIVQLTLTAAAEPPAPILAQGEGMISYTPGPESDLDQMRKIDIVRLIERGETLAQRFKLLAGEALQSVPLRFRLAIEAEVRLSDCKAIAFHSSAKEQFWEHLDSQMRRLESVLSVEEAGASSKADQQKLKSTGDRWRGEGGNRLDLKKRIPVFRALRPPQQVLQLDANGDSEEEGEISQSDEEGDVQEDSRLRAQDEASSSPGISPSNLNHENLDERCQRASETVLHDDVATGDQDTDVDMEVDMDTEDSNMPEVPDVLPSVEFQPSIVATTPHYAYPLPHEISYLPPAISLPPVVDTPLFPSITPIFPSVAPLYPAVLPSFPALESWVPPPPPEDEWAPPPPPESELAPPPPPDDEPPPLPSSPGSNTLEVGSPPPHPTSSPPPNPLDDSVSASAYHPSLNDQSTVEAGHVVKLGSGNYYSNTARLVVDEVDLSSTYNNGATPSTVAASTTSTETTSKRTGKVMKSKKRTHSMAVAASLRSNKKVSSMLNKWMAAKEELHSSEEEEEDKALFDIDALEKKRQKEIEEWRHQTLASGGALENANFQPLGTLDWRERVKRAKKSEAKKSDAKKVEEAKKETESKKEDGDAIEETKLEVADGIASASLTPPKRPDLKELSKDLPAGWQAFWDAESAEVYFGNLTTSETSWERPTN